MICLNGNSLTSPLSQARISQARIRALLVLQKNHGTEDTESEFNSTVTNSRLVYIKLKHLKTKYRNYGKPLMIR